MFYQNFNCFYLVTLERILIRKLKIKNFLMGRKQSQGKKIVRTEKLSKKLVKFRLFSKI